MREPDASLDSTVQSASEELARSGARFEVFARIGQTAHLHRDAAGSWGRRFTREVGIACRVARAGCAGFAAAAGSGARAGRDAATAAIAGLVAAPDPLPPREVLGWVMTPPLPPSADPQHQEEFARDLVSSLAQVEEGARLVQLRALTGVSTARLSTGEGFATTAEAAGAVVELLLAPPRGPWRHFHFAGRALSDLNPRTLAARAVEAALLAMDGSPAPRALADVLLSPAVAAPLVIALAQSLSQAGAARPTSRRPAKVSPAWQLSDQRAGPQGLLPLPCDGEGLPSRQIDIVANGRLCAPLTTWAQAQELGTAAGGAVRPSYRHAPVAGAANLVVDGTLGMTQRKLLQRLGDGFYLVMPAGAVRVDPGRGVFALRTAAVKIRHGRPVSAHPMVDLTGSFRRLLAGLEAAGDDAESFSQACAVTTPSLLVRHLEIA